MITPVILAGGSGSRLWPLSRELHPKQFLPLTGEISMLQETLNRLVGSVHKPPIVICNEAHRFLVAEQIRDLGIQGAQIILEPDARNTAPAIALAAICALERDIDSTLLVLSADHVIKDQEAFQKSISEALVLAHSGSLVTFGVKPDFPETGYGYIKSGRRGEGAGFVVDRFVEKPDKALAEEYLRDGGYYWNSGIFLFKAESYLAELDVFHPEICKSCRDSVKLKSQDLDFTRVEADSFKKCTSISVDFAVMEKTTRAMVVPLSSEWSDVGSWSSLWEESKKDSSGNALHGDVLIENCENLLAHSSHRLIAAVGVKNLVVVETKDAILVAGQESSQSVKKIVERLKVEGRSEQYCHREVYRPWGVYDSIDQGERYQVKRITVNPGAKLSVQMHHHRAEHWVVVSGTAKVTNGETSYLVAENESTYIPVGQVHALENPGKIPLELIEVQSGSYLGEDDIVRLTDRYGRT